MFKRNFFFSTLMSTLVLIFTVSISALAADLYVDDDLVQNPTAGYTTISAAIAAANPGDTIHVSPGLYKEQVVIGIPLTVYGATQGIDKNGYAVPANYAWDTTVESVIVPPDLLPDVLVVDISNTNDVVFDGFIVMATNRGSSGDRHLLRVNARNQTVNNVVVTNCIIGPNTNVVSQDGNKGRMGLYLALPSYSPFGVTNSTFSHNKIFDCKGNGNNVFVWGGAANYSANRGDLTGTVIENNEIYGSHRSGIETAGSADNLTIRNNKIYDNGVGATGELKYGNGIVVIRMGSDKARADGEGPDNLTITGNEIYGNGKNGIYTGPVLSNSTFDDNTIYDNGWDGIRMDQDEDYHGGPNPLYDKLVNNSAKLSKLENNAGYGIQVISQPAGPTNGFILNAQNSYWGAADGPSEKGPGSGQKVSDYVDFGSFYPAAKVGNLTVDITPAAAVAEGAQWSIDGGVTKYDSGITLTNIEAKDYTLTFFDTVNWVGPAAQTVTVNQNQTTTESGLYTFATGTLKVNISPAGAVGEGAQWSVDGGTTRYNSGDSVLLPIGNYVVSYYDTASWVAPADANVTVTKNLTTTETGTYTFATGNLTVNITPTDAVTEGAQWSLDGGATKYDSGDTVSDLDIGDHTVSFHDTASWVAPADATVTIEKNKTTTETGVYTYATGDLTVNISPAGAVGEGAQWSLDGGTTKYDSGDTVSGLDIGDHTVSFHDTASWVAPADATVTISKDQTTTETGIYTFATGSLKANITPAGAVTEGAQWSIDGGTTLFNSGDTIANLAIGIYTVTYFDSASWVAPAAETVTVNKNQTTTTTGTYTFATGSVTTSIEPAGAIADGAMWRLNGQKGWRASETTASGVPIGTHYVEFNAVTDWIKPDPMQITVVRDTTTSQTGTYISIEDTGGVSIEFDDPDLSNDGGAWRPVPNGAAPSANGWYESGDVATGIPFGDVEIEFRPTPGYVTPANMTIKVKRNTTVTISASYVRPFIAHRSDYNGDGADDLAVFDAKTRTWSIASTGTGKSSPAARIILEQKFGRKTDIPAPGDYDGDGVADLAAYRESSGQWLVRKQFTIKNFGQKRDIPVPGDYNGDGRTQPALYRPTTGEWLIYDYDSESVRTVNFGSANEIPVPGNYNGDAEGTTDLGVYNVITGKWRAAVYKAKRDKWAVFKKFTTTYGAKGDIPIQADYDGDGTTDPATYTQAGSIWKVKDQFELEFGIESDIPVPNDWAGLGRVIPAIFRPKNGRWIAVDNLLSARHGQGGKPLMSGR